MSDKNLEMNDLDETQLDALRDQLKAAIGGQAGGVGDIAAHPATHTSHGDSDGWI